MIRSTWGSGRRLRFSSCQVAGGQRPHRHAVGFHHAIDVLRHAALDQEALDLRATLAGHAVADETVAIADHHIELANAPPNLDRSGQRRE